MYGKFFKRFLDMVLASLALIALSPVILAVAVLVRVKLGSPVMFRQKRPGKNEKIFTMCKFRTMTNERGENGELLPDEVRLTKFGRFLRKTSIDELPELFNIIKGDMSIVGPRPLLVEYLPYYNAEQRRRHIVRPGLTGLAQVNGRNATTWDERFRYDVQYVEKVSFLRDLKIICATVGIVFRRKGISAEGHATMGSFIDSVNANVSVGISGALDPDSKEASAHAEQYYESVRKMSADIDRISENTDNPIDYISKIKEHLFIKKHDLGEYGIKRFDSDYDIAQSWQRLIDGKNIQPHDLILLKHEYMEQEYMSKGFSQQQAHDIANQEFNYKKSLSEWRR